MKTKLLLILSLIILVSCYKEEYILFLGENIYVQDAIFSKEFEKEYQKKINDEFIVNQFYIKDFYLKLDENALNINTENHLLDLIKDSYQIILNLGNNDLNYFIKNNKSILSKDRELYDYYLKAMEKIEKGSFTDSLPSDEELGKYGVRMGICAKRIATLMELKAPDVILQNEKCTF